MSTQPSICIPRVFSNITEERVRRAIDSFGAGKISKIDLVEIKYKKNTLFVENNLPYTIIPHRFVWRKGIYTFFKLFNHLFMNDNNIIEKYIKYNLNVICFSSQPLYTIFI